MSSCHSGSTRTVPHLQREKTQLKVALVGNPNVGKSVLFNALTGVYVTVSNYPGTTVEVAHGHRKMGHSELEVVDTPGVYSLLPITEDERVAWRVLFQESPDVVLHVVDAKNIKRMLPLTLQLVEAGFPVVLVVNIIDEAERLNIVIDREDLEKTLSIPVVLTSGINGRGLDELKRRLTQGTKSSVPKLRYGNRIETILESINGLDRDFEISRRAVALLLLQGDEEFLREVADRDQTKSKVYRHSGTPAIGPPDRCQMRSIPGLERRLLRGAA